MKALLKSNAFFRFIISAGFLYTFLYLLYQFFIKKYTLYDQKFIGTIIQSSDSILHFMSFKTFKVLQNRDMQVIGIDGSNGVWIGSPCNGINLFFLFSVFIVAYPGKNSNKIWYIPSGILLIHLMNLLRVVALCLISKYYPAFLNFNHTFTFTFIIYTIIFFLWVIWVNRFANNSKQSHS